jgi:hypothetical protein
MVRCGQEGGVAADEEILGGEARGGEEVEPGTTLPVGDGRDEAEVLADMPLPDPLTLITRAAECVMAEAEVLIVLCHFQLLDGAVQALRPECALSGVRRLLQVSR